MPDSNNNLNGHVVSSVIDFNMIVNTDIGLIKYIQEFYQDDKVFKLNEINRSDRDILSLLYSRKNSNPLSVFVKDKYLNDIDSLYKSFFDNYKQEILNYSIIFDNIYQFISIGMSNSTNLGINISIATSDELENNELYKHFDRISIVDKSLDKQFILRKDALYVNDYKFFDGYRDKVLHKRIYISPLQYNIDFLEEDESKFVTQNQFILFGIDLRLKGDNNNGTNK